MLRAKGVKRDKEIIEYSFLSFFSFIS